MKVNCLVKYHILTPMNMNWILVESVIFAVSCSRHVVVLNCTYSYSTKVTVWPYTRLGGASNRLSSQVRSCTMSVLLVHGHCRVRDYRIFEWHNVHTKFNQNPSSDSWIESFAKTDISQRTHICGGRGLHSKSEFYPHIHNFIALFCLYSD